MGIGAYLLFISVGLTRRRFPYFAAYLDTPLKFGVVATHSLCLATPIPLCYKYDILRQNDCEK